jgi:ferredoxin--NADP+ reductase
VIIVTESIHRSVATGSSSHRATPWAQGFPGPLERLLEAEAPVARVIAVGCTYLMYASAQATRPLGVKTVVSLNPIMVDGTGMCGACRCTAEGKTKFACVDGPDFDGHHVDWDELFTRRKSYFDDETRSLCRYEETELP